MRLATVGLSLLSLWAMAMVSLAIFGGYQLYSPVPYCDSWDGIVHFLQQPHLNSLAVWWAQHNEHRVVLSRILFWLDDRYFGGLSVFLLVVNYLCAAGAVFIFWRIVRRLSGTTHADKAQVAMGLFIVAWLFQWMQVENFAWAFQSQFFLAQLLPLCALYGMYLSVAQPQQPWLFWQACILGVLSCGTMANGVLALPLMTVYAVYLRQSRWHVTVLALLSFIMGLLYFYHFTKPIQHDSLGSALLRDPLGVMHYALLYLGNPFYCLLGQRKLGEIGATLSGVVFIGLVLRLAWLLWRQPVKQPLTMALLFYVLYIGATAVVTAGGREIFGVTQALVSRYTTPMLMAWLALLLAFQPFLRRQSLVLHRGWWLLLLCLVILMTRQQTKILRKQSDTAFQKNVAGLALELNVVDVEQLRVLYPPQPLHIWNTAQQAFAQQHFFFNHYPFAGLRQSLTHSVPVIGIAPVCQANISQRLPIAADLRFMGVEGGLSQPTHADVVRFLNEKQEIIGYAIMSPHVDKDSDRQWPYVYKGYVLAKPLSMITLQVLHKDSVLCQVRLPISP